MRFQKWQGTGNDHIVVERDALPWPMSAARAVALCDRHRGVGADGVLEVSFDDGHPRMTVWNADGTCSENCGNGIRIVARYLHDAGRLPADGVILTGDQTTRVRVLDDGRVEVRMGAARLPGGTRHDHLQVDGSSVRFAEVSMGNPHAVVEHWDPDAVVTTLGPAMETDPRFPERTNVEFVRIDGPSELTMRVWERGVGRTLACGTGACAAAVAAVCMDGLTSPVTVHLEGGDLLIAVDDDLTVTMTGPAEPVFAGELAPALRALLDAAA